MVSGVQRWILGAQWDTARWESCNFSCAPWNPDHLWDRQAAIPKLQHSSIKKRRNTMETDPQPSVDVFNTSNYRHKISSSIISVLQLYLHLEALTNHCRTDGWAQNKSQKCHFPAPSHQVFTCVLLQEWLEADHTNLNLSRRWDEVFRLPHKFQSLGNAPPETGGSHNVNHSNEISKTFSLYPLLTSGSLPSCNNSELTSINQSLIFPCIQPQSLASFFVCQ